MEWKGRKFQRRGSLPKYTRAVQSRFLGSFFRNGGGCATFSSDLIIFNEHASPPGTGNRSPFLIRMAERKFILRQDNT